MTTAAHTNEHVECSVHGGVQDDHTHSEFMDMYTDSPVQCACGHPGQPHYLYASSFLPSQMGDLFFFFFVGLKCKELKIFLFGF